VRFALSGYRRASSTRHR